MNNRRISRNNFLFNKNTTNPTSRMNFLHCHSKYEIYYFLKGDVNYKVEGKYFKPTPESVLLIKPGVVHGLEVASSTLYTRYALHFDEEIIPTSFRNNFLKPFDNNIFLENVNNFDLENYFKQILDLNNFNGKEKNSLIDIRFLSLLSQIFYISKENKNTVCEKNSIPESINKIIDYLNINFTQSISLDDLSKNFFISKHYLNKLFKQYTGTTVIDYITRKRIAFAEQLIKKGELATEVALKVGFNDYSVFYRAYKKIFNHNPSFSK